MDINTNPFYSLISAFRAEQIVNKIFVGKQLLILMT